MSNHQLSILFPDQDRVLYQAVPEETWHNLGLDSLVSKVAKKPQDIPLLQRVMTSLTADPAVSRFRSEVFQDLLDNPKIRNQLMELLEKVRMFYDYGVVQRRDADEAGIWDLMHRLEEYHDYILTVEAIQACLSEQRIRSEGLTRLRDEIRRIYESHAFSALRQDVEAMRVSASKVQSLTVGINLNDRFEAVSMGLVSVNAKPFTRSGLLKHFASALSVKDEISPEADWNGSLSFQPAELLSTGADMESLMKTSMIMRNPLVGLTLASVPREDGSSDASHQMDTAASRLVSRLTRKLKDTLGKYMNTSVREIADLIPELLFYVRWAEYIESCREQGWRFCRPMAREASGGVPGMSARGFYNLKLIDSVTPAEAVTNDLDFDPEKRVYLLTGANRGGKTTVTQAVGQLFLLAQSGISVPAESFSFDPTDRVLTHFPADEDRTLDLGRLGEECQRFRGLFQQCTGRSLLLLNETFSTTSFEEGYYIAVDAVRAILRKGARTIYNTHMHNLARNLDTAINEEGLEAKAVSLTAETVEGRSTFRVRIAPPEGKSYARGIAEKYGVTYEALTHEGAGSAEG